MNTKNVLQNNFKKIVVVCVVLLIGLTSILLVVIPKSVLYEPCFSPEFKTVETDRDAYDPLHPIIHMSAFMSCTMMQNESVEATIMIEDKCERVSPFIRTIKLVKTFGLDKYEGKIELQEYYMEDYVECVREKTEVKIIFILKTSWGTIIDEESITVQYYKDAQIDIPVDPGTISTEKLEIENVEFYMIGTTKGFAVPVMTFGEIFLKKEENGETIYEEIQLERFLDNSKTSVLSAFFSDATTINYFGASSAMLGRGLVEFYPEMTSIDDTVKLEIKIEYIEEGWNGAVSSLDMEELIQLDRIPILYVTYSLCVTPSADKKKAFVEIRGDIVQFSLDANENIYLRNVDESYFPPYFLDSIEHRLQMNYTMSKSGELKKMKLDTIISREDFETRTHFKKDITLDLVTGITNLNNISEYNLYPIEFEWELETYVETKLVEGNYNYYYILGGSDEKLEIFEHNDNGNLSSDSSFCRDNEDLECEYVISSLPDFITNINMIRNFFLGLCHLESLLGTLGKIILSFFTFIFCGAMNDSFGTGTFGFINYTMFKAMTLLFIIWGFARFGIGVVLGVKEGIVDGIKLICVPVIINFIICYTGINFKLIATVVVMWINALISIGNIFSSSQYTVDVTNVSTYDILSFLFTIIILIVCLLVIYINVKSLRYTVKPNKKGGRKKNGR